MSARRGLKLVAQQPEQAEDHVTGAGRIAHDLRGIETGLLLKQAFQDEQRIAERAGHDNAMEAGKLVGGEVVVGDSSIRPEVFAVGPSVDGADRDDKPQAIGGGDISAAPFLGQRQRSLGVTSRALAG